MFQIFLYILYKVIKDEELENKVIVIEQADLGMRYLESWNLINEISVRKVTQSSQLNGNNAEDRVVLWYVIYILFMHPHYPYTRIPIYIYIYIYIYMQCILCIYHYIHIYINIIF